ncbi:MAG: AhpC/TSA family protein [Polyangiaceae bacterium]
MGVEVGKPLSEALLGSRVTTVQGEVHALSELVPQGAPALLLFVRQFACAGCGQRVAELLLNERVLRMAGVSIVVVGCGSLEHAQEFSRALALDTHELCLATDPTLVSHQAAGLVRSYWGVLGPIGTFHLLRAMGRGHRNGWGHGDFYQLGGSFLLDDRGVVLARHVERHLGSTLPLGDLVERALALFGRRNPELSLP